MDPVLLLVLFLHLLPEIWHLGLPLHCSTAQLDSLRDLGHLGLD